MKSTSVIIAVALGLLGATPAGAEPIRLAQILAADIIPPYEVFTIIRSMGMRPLGRPHYRGRFYVVHAVSPRGEEVRVTVDAYAARVVSVRPLDRVATEYDGPVYRRYDSGPPGPPPRVIESDPRYVPPRAVPSDPRYSAPQVFPEDDEDYRGAEPDEFDAEDEGETGSLPPRGESRSVVMPRMPPAITEPSTRSVAATPPKTPLPRPRPQQLAKASEPAAAVPAAKVESEDLKADTSAQDKAKPETQKAEAEKSDPAKAETPKSGIRIIEIKRPEPRI